MGKCIILLRSKGELLISFVDSATEQASQVVWNLSPKLGKEWLVGTGFCPKLPYFLKQVPASNYHSSLWEIIDNTHHPRLSAMVLVRVTPYTLLHWWWLFCFHTSMFCRFSWACKELQPQKEKKTTFSLVYPQKMLRVFPEIFEIITTLNVHTLSSLSTGVTAFSS